jgi:hypothetical protein
MKRMMWALAAIVIVAALGKAQAPAGQVFGEGPVFVTALSQCYWLASVPVTTPAVAQCFVDTGLPSTSGMYFSLSSGPTIWTPEGAPPLTAAALKSAVLAAGITVNVPAQPAAVGTLQ